MLLLFLIFFIHKDRSYNKKNLILLPKKQALSLLPSQWYYININSYGDIKTIQSILPNLKISPLELNGDLLTLFLTPSEARLLNKLSNINVYTKAPKRTTLSTLMQNNSTYMIYAHSSFKAPQYSKTISHNGPFYFISTNQPTMIENDPTVLSINKLPHMKLMNRWTTGFIQSGDPNYIIKNGFYMSNRKYHERGLNGSNVIVTLIDSGTEVNNCLFNDPNHDTPFNETNFNHRKIVRYDPFADRYDKIIGHGTHCAGIIAGSTDSFPLNLYNGHAPGAKLYVADIGKDEEYSIETSFIFEIFEQAKKLGSPILSCSWGSPVIEHEFTQIFDYLSYTNPNQLFVFAAGNDANYYTIGSPTNSKNVLTIASSNPPHSYYLNDRSHIVKIVSGSESIQVVSTNVFMSMQKYDISYLNDIELVFYNEKFDGGYYSNKAVVINDTSKKDDFYESTYNLLAKNKAKAVIVYDRAAINHQEIIIISTIPERNLFFEMHNKINITVEVPSNPIGITVTSSSSKGPTFYGNRKPDVMAPGQFISSASNGANSNECTAASSLIEMSGTSMATPAISGSLALVYQYLKESIHRLQFSKPNEITSALLRAFAIAGSGDQADIESGYGNLNLSRILVYPNLDFEKGLRFYSDKMINNEFISFFIKTDHKGSLSVSLAWIDVPINLESLHPLFSYFEFYVIGPDGNVYDDEEQYSTTKKIVINDASVGTYEIRLHMNQMIPSEYSVDYSIVVVGPFDHLNFDSNPSELKPSTTKSCSSKCPINSGHAKCDTETATCVCDALHTGTNCEFDVLETHENVEIKNDLMNRNFMYIHLDLSKYKNMKKIDRKNYLLSVHFKCICYNPYVSGFIRYFFNNDNKMPLSIPRNLIDFNENLVFSVDFSLYDVMDADDAYLTIFNDYGSGISVGLNWTVKLSEISVSSSKNELTNLDSNERSAKFTETKTFKILMLSLIVTGGIAIICIVVLLIVKTAKKKKKFIASNYQQYTDYELNN